MNKINWCIKQKNGLELIEPNQNLSNAYIKKAEEALESMHINTIKDWKISTAYYTIYFALYSILMKLGVKCEIHSCTIQFIKSFFQNHFTSEQISFIENAQQTRIDSQYYVDRAIHDEQYNTLIQQTPFLLIHCKQILLTITEKERNTIRNILQNIINK